MKRYFPCASLLTLALVATSAPAQQPAPVPAAQPGGALPTGAELLQRFIAAVGGREALERQSGRRAWGVVEVPSQALRGNLELVMAPPDRFLMLIDLSGFGRIRAGYDGQTAWTMNPALGPQILDGLALNQMREGADLLAPLHRERYVASAETLGEVDFGGARCYRVRVTTTWGESYHEYYDRASGLLAGSERQSATAMGTIETTTFLSDYRDAGGVRMPFVTRQRMLSLEQVLRIDSLRVLQIPDSVFALPREVAALRRP